MVAKCPALLTRHTSRPAQQTLTKLGGDTEPTIAAVALEVLLSIDPELVLPLVPQSLTSSDANVRRDPENPFWSEPIYELYYSFHVNKNLLATVHYRRGDSNAPRPSLEHVRTRVYASPATK